MTVVDTPPVRVTSEPLTYERHRQVSYFQDLVALYRHNDPAATQRLARHAQEMRALSEIHDATSEARLRVAGITYRVAPNRTQGQGGYFAPPLWLNEAFATAPRTGRVLAALMPHFDLPANVQTVNVPFLPTGTSEQAGPDNAPVPDSDLADNVTTSAVVTIDGKTDVSIQLLEQSPPGAHVDWVVFTDLAEAYDQQLESQLITGTGAAGQLTGVTTPSSINTVTWTNGAPTDVLMYQQLGITAAKVGNFRKRPPEAWLMRTARWAWLGSSPDGSSRPFVLPGTGRSDPAGDPTGQMVTDDLLGWPAYVDDVIPNTLGTGGNQDEIICLRPSDLMLLEGAPNTSVLGEVLSGTLQVRLLYRNYVAAITGRRTSGIAVLTGTGMILPATFSS